MRIIGISSNYHNMTIITRTFSRRLSAIALTLLTAALVSPTAGLKASLVDLGQAGQFTMLALTGGIDDSGPLGPQSNPNSVDGPVGVASDSQKFQASGSVKYNGPIYLHSNDTFNSSAPGVPQPTMGSSVDSMLAQAKTDAFNASTFASGLAATATYGTINNNLTITEHSVGNYVFNIQNINFSGGKTLTLNAPGGSNYVLNISGSLVLTFGSINVAGGLSPANVLINYTGTNVVQFSGGGNSSQIYGTILAPNAEVGLHPGLVVGSVIAGSITMSSGANVVPVPEVTPSSVIFGFLGLIVAVSSRRALMGQVRAVSARRKTRLD
jgi:choice-of-anchor A domain-containing protein